MNRGKLKNIVASMVIIISAISCEEVIVVDLRSRPPELVVEGFIALDSTSIVKLSMTTDYFENTQADPVTGATIILETDNGESETLVHRGNGFYTGSSVIGTTGVTYTIRINNDGEEIAGYTYLPEPVKIISTEGIEPPFGRPDDEPVYIIEVKFTDSPETENYYMLRFYRNDTIMSESISLASNAYNSTGTVEYTEWRYEFSPGDSAVVEVYSIDSALYSYFSMLNEVTSFGINFSTPYNPGSTLSGNTLGYFGSWSYVSDSTVIK